MLSENYLSMVGEVALAVAETSSAVLEIIGVATIVIAAFVGLGRAMWAFIRPARRASLYSDLRHLLARGILLGLELLVAADIITSVAVRLDFRSVAVLGILVLIRTFLSFSLEVEISGHWPWQGARRSSRDKALAPS